MSEASIPASAAIAASSRFDRRGLIRRTEGLLVTGLQNVDRKLAEVGGIDGLTGYRLIARIFLPAALPNLFTGLRTGLSLSWMFLVAAELIAARRGLGYLLTDGRESGRADLVIVAIVIPALLGKTSDSLLRRREDRLLGWRDVAAIRRS